jgi:flavin reductase (DIM6/NTAB) family NADH-FMN oxidoreductase RutF
MMNGNKAKAHRLLAPRVAYLVGTRGSDGEPNLIPVSNLTSVSTDPELIVLAVFKEWQTFRNLKDSSQFTVSVPRNEHLAGVWKLGSRYSRIPFRTTSDKLAGCGLSILNQDDLPGPILEDGVGWLVCRKVQEVQSAGDHGIFIAEITEVAFNADYLDRDGLPQRPSSPVMQVTGNLFTTSAENSTLPFGDAAEYL